MPQPPLAPPHSLTSPDATRCGKLPGPHSFTINNNTYLFFYVCWLTSNLYNSNVNIMYDLRKIIKTNVRKSGQQPEVEPSK